ncbi:mechanosensitive ion channel family protein [Quisquiliibacterium transsilvanicum]|nr:mechanosensitive ion channel family protein [Quisquiliibacterium transsilvanicum]
MTLPFLAGHEPWIQALAGLALMSLLAMSARWLAHWLLQRSLRRSADTLQGRWSRVFLHRTVLGRLARVTPSLVVQLTVGAIPHLPDTANAVIRNVAVALTVLHLVRVLMALLDALHEEHEGRGRSEKAPTRSIKSHVQLAKLALVMLGGIVIVAALIDRSPLILLSGLGAMSAVLMLVFKDTLLSFTAGLQLASNDMLRVGDWIEMPQLGADGDVIDIALHTVKVQNWDKTITTIPTWRLMSESFRNWRGMSEAGGRRIKRTLRLDAGSVRFLDEDEIARLKRIALLRPYLERKEQDVREANETLATRLGELAVAPANRRRLTNLGTFRAYVDAYLRKHPGIHKEMTLMVRAMEPSSEGVPMEIYCFTGTTAWVQYEGIQSDIFDHLLAILPEFGLRLYQNPTGHDIDQGLATRLARDQAGTRSA